MLTFILFTQMQANKIKALNIWLLNAVWFIDFKQRNLHLSFTIRNDLENQVKCKEKLNKIIIIYQTAIILAIKRK